jgi:hypothetical protein
MNKEELRKWFNNKFNLCYSITHSDYPNCIYWYYDEQIARKIKMCKICNSDYIITNQIKGICLFEQNVFTKKLWCDYDEVWSFFITNYSTDYNEVKCLILEILLDNEKLFLYTPYHSYYPLRPNIIK